MTKPMWGKVLVATEDMPDPVFQGAEVLLIRLTTQDATSGLIINRPLTTNNIPEEAILPVDRKAICYGGPMGEGAMLVVHDRKDMPCSLDLLPEHDLYGAMRTFGDLPNARELMDAARCRVFQGFAAWSEGQLDIELSMEFWRVRDFDPEKDFWREV